MNVNATTDRNIYGAVESNGLVNGPEYHAARGKVKSVLWTEPGLKITRLRLLSDPGFPHWDVSYCHGKLADGTDVDVVLPFSQLPKRGMRGEILRRAKLDKVYAKELGVFDAISTLC